MIFFLFSPIFLLSTLNIPFGQVHDFHLSKCEIEYKHDSKSLEMSMSIFLDDLELALKQEGTEDLAFCTSKESERAEGIVFDYIKRHLIIRVDGVIYDNFQWVGKELSDDLAAVWCYIEVLDVQQPVRNVEVSYVALMEVFDDQQNVVKLTLPSAKKGYFLLTSRERTGSLRL